MSYMWTDVTDIAIELYENNPDIDPKFIRFTDLYKLICNLEQFKDSPDRCNEKILEAIQAAWIEEAV